MWRSAVQPIHPATVQRPALTSNESAEKLALFKPAPVHPTHKQFGAMTFWVHIPYHQKEVGFQQVNLIRARGGVTVNDPDDASITHMVINVPGDFQPGITFSDEDLAHTGSTDRPGPKWKLLVRKYAKFQNCDSDSGQADTVITLNEGRTRKVYRMEWLEEVLAGRLKVAEDGPWEVWRRSCNGPEEEEGEVTMATSSLPVPPVAVDPRTRFRSPSGNVQSTPAQSPNASWSPVRSPLITTAEGTDTASHALDLEATDNSMSENDHCGMPDARPSGNPDQSPARTTGCPPDTPVEVETATVDSPLTSAPASPEPHTDDAPSKRNSDEIAEPPTSKRARHSLDSLDSLAKIDFFRRPVFGASAVPRAVSNPLPVKHKEVPNDIQKNPSRASAIDSSTNSSATQDQGVTNHRSTPPTESSPRAPTEAVQSTIKPRSESASQLDFAKSSTPDPPPVACVVSTPWSASAVSTKVGLVSTPVQAAAGSFSSNAKASTTQQSVKIDFSAEPKFGASSISPTSPKFPSLRGPADKSEVKVAPIRPTIDTPSDGAKATRMVVAEGDRFKATITKPSSFGASSLSTFSSYPPIRKTSMNDDDKAMPSQPNAAPAAPLAVPSTIKSPSPFITTLPRGREQTPIKSEPIGFARYSEKPASLTTKPQIDEKEEVKSVEPRVPEHSHQANDKPNGHRARPRFTLRRRDPKFDPRPRAQRPLESLITKVQREWLDNEAMNSAARLPCDLMSFFDIIERTSPSSGSVREGNQKPDGGKSSPALSRVG